MTEGKHMRRLNENVFEQDLLLSGTAFLEAICRTATREFSADFAFVGSLRIAESERMFLQAFQIKEADVTNTDYDVCVAPCQQAVIEKKTVVHKCDLQYRFPNSAGIKKFGMDSYIGCPLLDHEGSAIGIFVLEWRKPLSEDQSICIQNALETIAPRVSSEVENLNNAHALKVLMQPMTRREDDDLDAICSTTLQLANLAQVKSAFIAECLDEDQREFRILASVTDAKIEKEISGVTLKYDDTPCRDLRSRDTIFIERDLMDLFPDTAYFEQRNIQSYFGKLLRNKSGTPIGHVVLLHDRPLSPRLLQSELLNATLKRVLRELENELVERGLEELRSSMEVRKKLQSLGLMAGTVAHDFNNLLFAIIGHTELAKMELKKHDSAYSYIELAEKTMWRARDIVIDLMEFAGMNSDSETEMVDLNAIIQGALELLLPCDSDRCLVNCDLQSQLPSILGRQNQIHQIVTNLVLNSLDAMNDTDGVLTVKTASVNVPRRDADRCMTGHLATMTGQCVLLRISDNGHGMNQETIDRIFDPYFSTKNNGRGLGLAGVLGIAQRMNAGLTVTSQVGQGTTVCLYFNITTC